MICRRFEVDIDISLLGRLVLIYFLPLEYDALCFSGNKMLLLYRSLSTSPLLTGL